MRCKKCDYPLWTIAARSCPECGESFKPSDFEFRRGAVKFCCPHCRQEYFGTSARGHLEPREFNCVRCGQHITMDETVLEPADPGSLDAATTATFQPNPWAERGQTNVAVAWIKSAGAILSEPQVFGASMPATATVGRAVTFCAVGTILLCVASMLCSMPMMFFMAGAGPGVGAPVGAAMVGMIVWAALQHLVFAVIFVPLAAAIAHGILLVTGGTTHGIGRSMQAVLYAEGAVSLIMLIPCIGFIARIWWVVSTCFLLMRMQGVGGGRAALATIPTLLVTLGLTVGAFLLPIFPGIAGTTALPATWTGGTTAYQFGAEQVAAGIYTNAVSNDFQWPRTPLDALADGSINGESLLTMVAPDGTSRGIGSAMQSDIIFGAGNGNVRRAADELAAKLPPEGGLIRLGNAVFTYHGIPKSAFDDGRASALWLAVVFPTDSDGVIQAYSATGTEDIPPGLFQARFQAQNSFRVEIGASELPDLKLVPDWRDSTAQ